MPASRSLLVLLAVATALLSSATAIAQPAPDPPPDGVREVEPRDHELPADPADPATAAQADVEKARKLLKLQKYEDAIALLEQAYLTLEDPELIRMLGDAHADLGATDKALRYYDTYLADPNVGDSAKEPVRTRRDALARAAKGKAHDDGAQNPDDESVADAVGVTDWASGGAAFGEPGRLYLMAGGHFLYNPGGSFATARGGAGEGADTILRGDWVHGGIGVVLGVGGYILDDLSLGLQIGNDWMNWEGRAPTLPFETTIYSGLRPELALELRYLLGLGTAVGLTAGGDAIILSDDGKPDPACQPGIDCPDFEVKSGIQGYRVFFGAILGYRTELAESWQLGADVNFRYAPVFVGAKDLVDDLPGYGDPSWMLEVGVGVWWNL